MKSFSPHKEILPPAQQSLWSSFKEMQGDGFVLYGGTAVALQLGHRQSVDFDFFSVAPLDKKAVLEYAFLQQGEVRQDTLDTLSLRLRTDHGDVDISYFGGIDFLEHDDALITNDGVLEVASLKSLMATKVAVILKRAESKDYSDIASMVRSGVDLKEGLRDARKYFSAFQPAEALRALTYFKDGDLDSLPVEDKKTLVESVDSIQQEILSYYQRNNGQELDR